MATKYMSGKAQVSLNGVTIPPQYISDDGVKTTLKEGETEIKTMAGVFKQPNGMMDEATSMFSVVLPDMNYLKNVFPEMYTASTDRPTVAGQTKFGGNTCSARENTPVVVHYTCDSNSDNDIYIPNGSVVANVEIQQNAGDPVVVEITINAQPDDTLNGAVAILGTGSLTGPTLWNPATETYEAVAS